jgi:hypothetical protein
MQKLYTYLTISSRILLYLSRYSSGSIITLLYAPLTLNKTKDRVFLPLYTLKIDSYRYDIAYVINFCFYALKWVFGNNL